MKGVSVQERDKINQCHISKINEIFHERRQFRNREIVCGGGLQFIFITLTRSTVFTHHLSAEGVTMATRAVVVVAAFRDTGLKHPVVSRGTAEAAAL